MTFTINVPVFPMRKEIEARRPKMSGLPGQVSRPRSRDVHGFLEMEMLPLEQIDSVETAKSRWRRRSAGALRQG